MTKQIENYLTANAHLKKRRVMFVNFLGGLAWGLGTVLGATIVAAIVIAILRFFNFIPGFNQILDALPKSSPSLFK